MVTVLAVLFISAALFGPLAYVSGITLIRGRMRRL